MKRSSKRWISRKNRGKFGKALSQIERILTFPLKIFALPRVLLGLFHNRGVNVNENRYRRKSSRRKRALLSVLGWPIKVVFFPAYLVRLAYLRRKQKDLLFFIPAVATFLLIVFVLYRVKYREGRIDNRYLSHARRYADVGNLEMAKKYISRVMDKDELPPAHVLSWAVILGLTGEKDRANQLLDEIAPDNELGYRPAHSVKAINLANEIGKNANSEDLDLLKHHLENSGRRDSEMHRAWAGYFVLSNQPAKALGHLEQAIYDFPDLLLVKAEIHKERGEEKSREEALKTARNKFRMLLAERPLDIGYRLVLASALMELGDNSETERILLQGYELNPEPSICRATSAYYLRLINDSPDMTFERKLTIIKRAILIDPTNIEIHLLLKRMLDVTEEDRSDLKKSLLSIATSENAEGLDHANLARVLWQEGNREEVDWNLGQAWRMATDFSKTADALAQSYIQGEIVDLDWAKILAENAIDKAPDGTYYHETLGSVLLLQENYEGAIRVLDEAVKNGVDQKGIYEKLEIAHRATGNLQAAEKFHNETLRFEKE